MNLLGLCKNPNYLQTFFKKINHKNFIFLINLDFFTIISMHETIILTINLISIKKSIEIQMALEFTIIPIW